MVDFDRARLRIPNTGWREANLARLHRSLRKLRGTCSLEAVDAGFARLRAGYQAIWERGY
jgi:3-deoxy-D-manno-octulosonic acid kinase